ncbi:YggS family pyridoxal phosphate-dependent enzyme [Rhodopirellula sp. MGV]|uniref:YggS family pyridoxal phosphate-dependent enzyme n=1 Tax=Rhodopirellula sp. MGV TaxID=2023130 RepID=UPI000B977EF2|nr:YggS family pyridoxal phosphate-dependent enzyme [Rhodopirellula sp. MGV]OYP38880.1 YggS family pyridoxal phosphate-dependent enzyme [Rhodopirellula sp. MGV]PNY38307.1 YggS family pyridoxal phosphate-dependent enzyme [Rhodopirellula baltica]
MNVSEQILVNYQNVITEMGEAVRSAGRPQDSVRLVGVSKYVDAPTTQCLVDAGCRDLGENRPQVLWQKAESLVVPQDFQWHMIGHLQTNKVRRLLKHSPLIHSVDSERLLLAIEDESKLQSRTTDVLLEVNISGDEAKTGLPPDEVRRLATLQKWDAIRIRGLMAMAGWGTEADEAGKQFAEVAKLRDDLQSDLGLELPELSMGMSGDYPEAIAAGATLVRIGSALFEGVPRLAKH